MPARQKILRVKATFEVPFANVTEGAVAFNALRKMTEPGNLAEAYKIPNLSAAFDVIMETTREAPKVTPAKLVAE